MSLASAKFQPLGSLRSLQFLIPRLWPARIPGFPLPSLTQLGFSVVPSDFFTKFQIFFRHIRRAKSGLIILVRMWNIDAVFLAKWKYWNEKQLEIIFVNRHNSICHKAIFQDFTVFFSYEFGFDSEDEEHWG